MGDCLILAYHALSPTWPASLSTEPERLDAQLGTLAEIGLPALTRTICCAAWVQDLAVTFDDGFPFGDRPRLADPLASWLRRYGVRPDRSHR